MKIYIHRGFHIWSAVSIGKQDLRQFPEKVETFESCLETRLKTRSVVATTCGMARYNQILIAINRWFDQFALVTPGGPSKEAKAEGALTKVGSILLDYV